MPCQYGIIRILGIAAFFAYRQLQSLSETVKSHPNQVVARRLPHGRRGCLRASQATIAVSDSCVSLPLFTCDRATTSTLQQMTRIAAFRLCRPRLRLRRWFPYILLIAPKTASTMLRWWYSSPVCSGHIALGLVAPVLADGVGLGPDARYHALVGYGVVDLLGQVGRV